MKNNKLQEAKINSILNTKMNYSNYGIMTRRDWLHKMLDKGAYCESREVPKYGFNRIKFNRMEWDEQAAYEKKLEEKKIGYFIYPEGKEKPFYEITKTEYNYYLSIQLAN